MSTTKFFDSHTHTQFAAFAKDQNSVIERALKAGVWMVNIGTQKDTSAKAVKIAEKFPEGVYAAVGLHPIHTERSYHDAQELGGEKEFISREEGLDYDFYKRLAKNPKVVAIGECGLDYYRLGTDTKEKQTAVFLKQIELAYELKKPLMVHCRQAFADLIKILTSESKNLNSAPGIIHFFSGTIEDAKKLLVMGFSFTFGGVITFVRDYDEVIKYIPLDRIMLETDAPYVAPIPYRGKRNEPAYVEEVARKLVEIKNTNINTVATQTSQNAKDIFQI